MGDDEASVFAFVTSRCKSCSSLRWPIECFLVTTGFFFFFFPVSTAATGEEKTNVQKSAPSYLGTQRASSIFLSGLPAGK